MSHPKLEEMETTGLTLSSRKPNQFSQYTPNKFVFVGSRSVKTSLISDQPLRHN